MITLCYDIGTTGVKTCLFEITDRIQLLSGASAGYKLYILPGGGAEQDPEEWWQAMCATTHTVLEKSGINPATIEGISFCSQMQGLVLVDVRGKPLRRAFSYMDQRAGAQLRKYMKNGLQVAGANVGKLLKSLAATGAAALSVKDPVYKYLWTKENEPELFARVHKWLDVKESLISRMTGEFVMTHDSAFATLLYDIHEGKKGWSPAMLSLFGVNPAHMPRIIPGEAVAGTLTAASAAELGLPPGIDVYGGGGDASLIGVGAGATELGDTHIYSGTSGWVSTVVEKSIVDATAMVAAIVGADSKAFNYFAEQETAGKCVEWVKDHLALDEINIYLNNTTEKTYKRPDMEETYTNLYDYMMAVIKDVPVGAGGVLFTPWLHGNRCPFEDANARAMFWGIGLETGKTELIRAVAEGVIYHLRWMLETQERKITTSKTIRFVGGGALSPVLCQMLADCTGRTIETVDSPQNAGSVGAAVLVAVGKGLLPSVREAKKLLPANAAYAPDPAKTAQYDKVFAIYKQLYSANKKLFRIRSKLQET
ncbi:MAG: FGGY-family carbohydrate kinase [Oscillospiraceae bacterium]|jgi:xylulokinase|nr:FGGY-family carbohydrate kinase [Oscillospiraceae bacterium]